MDSGRNMGERQKTGVRNQKEEKQRLVGLVVGAAAEAVVQGLTAFEARLDGVPVVDGGLAEAPAEEDDFVIEAAGEVEESGLEVFDLDADLVDFCDGFACALKVLIDISALAGGIRRVDMHAAHEIDAAGDFKESSFGFFSGVPGLDRALEERLENRQEGLSFFESEGFHGKPVDRIRRNAVRPKCRLRGQ